MARDESQDRTRDTLLSTTLARRLAARRADAVPEGLLRFIAALWSSALRFDAADPAWPDRDRFVLSDYAHTALHRELLLLCDVDGVEHAIESPAPAHTGPRTGMEAIAGLPGQGLAAAVGLALAERILATRFGRSLVDHRTWVLASASELAAGLGQEAGSLAGELRLDRLAVVFEEPAPTREGGRDKDEIELLRRFAACGWAVRSVDGTDAEDVALCLAAVARARRPTLIACSTARPHAALDARAVPEAGLAAWRAVGHAGASKRRAWLKRLSHHARRAEFEQVIGSDLQHPWPRLLASRRAQAGGDGGAPLEAAVSALAALAATEPAGRPLVHLSSSRAGDVFAQREKLTRASYGGRHLACDGREHGMTMLAHGLALHGGVMPVTASPTVAADRIRPALRLASLAGARMIHLLTEDGRSARFESPVFQPVEQIASLRAIPGLLVFRPGCAIEASECLELALRRGDGPSVILLSADPLPASRAQPGSNASVRGGYVVDDAAMSRRDATLIATGSELELARAARTLLARSRIDVAVVSLPCWELFARQPPAYRERVLGTAPRFGIEAACGFGWERWLGAAGSFIGLTDPATGTGRPGGGGLRGRAGLTAEDIAETVARSI